MTTNKDTDLMSIERITQSNLVLRRQRVLLDSELAALYGVVVRAFVHLRDILASDTELARRVTKLERGHESHDSAIVGILKAIHELKNVPQTRAIGFFQLEEKKR